MMMIRLIELLLSHSLRSNIKFNGNDIPNMEIKNTLRHLFILSFSTMSAHSRHSFAQ